MIFAAAALLVAAAAPAQAPDWSQRAATAANGAFVIGNPAARVRLTEYLSFTCSHCADFAAESKASLRRDYVAPGRVRIEVRHYVFNPLDMAAALLARCEGPQRFLGHSEAIFAAQDRWLAQGQRYLTANRTRLVKLPIATALQQYARGSGLEALMRARGLTPGRAASCLANTAEQERLAAMTAEAARLGVTGTPWFVINDQGGIGTWGSVKAGLDAAL